MDFIIGLDSTFYIVMISALVAAVSFAAFAAPFLARSEKKERYKEVIEKKRRALFEQAQQQASQNTGKQKDMSAAQSIALFYKLQALAGEASTSARNMMLRAGIRHPMAPFVYLISRVVLPVIFMIVTMAFLASSDEEMSQGMKTLILIGSVMVGFFLPMVIVKNSADKRQQEISLAFPDSLDMMLICVQGGIGIEAAINRISDTIAEHSLALAEELGILSAELSMLNDRRAAFLGFATRVGSGSARTFSTAMLQAEQYGTSISKALRTLADESREMRMAAAEQKAAALPPKLTVPMILFFLPALFVVILGPAFLKGGDGGGH